MNDIIYALFVCYLIATVKEFHFNYYWANIPA